MLTRKNRKNRRKGKVVIPDLLANVRHRADHFGNANRRRLIGGIKLALAALVVYAFAVGPTGFMRLIGLYREQRDLRAEDQQLNAEIVRLENIRRGLEIDTCYIEKIAREDYGLSRPDEIIYLESASGDSK